MAIDPPYRLDPFQNIINVNWGSPPSPGTQLFVFTRNEEWTGNFYPVSEEFFSDVAAANETQETDSFFIPIVATRLKHSALIDAAMNLEYPYTDDPDIPPQGPGFHIAWFVISEGNAPGQLGGCDAVQPNRSNPPVGGRGNVYVFCKGSYLYDDMETGDWPPEFQPLPP